MPCSWCEAWLFHYFIRGRLVYPERWALLRVSANGRNSIIDTYYPMATLRPPEVFR